MKKLIVSAMCIFMLICCRKEQSTPSTSKHPREIRVQTVPKCGNDLDPQFTAQMKAAVASYDEQENVSMKRPKEFPQHHDEPTIIFLDTDGHIVKNKIWNWLGKFSFPAAGLSATQMNLILQSVTEDFSPFQIIVTADEKLYDKAKNGKRIRVIITRHHGLEQIFPTSGGVAFTGSFWWGNDTPCFVFADRFGGNAAHIAETVSHMTGHTFGLEHQAEYSFIPPWPLKTEFHNGFFSQIWRLFWKPIMGNPYNGDLSGWMVGRTLAGSFNLARTQDDMGILSALGVKPDAAVAIIVNSPSKTVGFINRPGDHDEYEVNSDEIKFSVQAGGNCKLRVVAFNSDRQLIAEYIDNNNLGISEKTIKTNGNKIYLTVGALDASGLLIGDLFSQPQMAGQYTLVVNK